jgi:ElaB/YqjD/DUF883 family membrane-anchored ribosome-binding protein
LIDLNRCVAAQNAEPSFDRCVRAFDYIKLSKKETMMTSNKKVELASVTDQLDLSILRSDIDTIKSDIMTLTKHVREEGTNGSRLVKRMANDQKDRLLEQLIDIQDAGGRKLAKLEKTVSKKPTQSVAIAFAAGLIASFLLGGRD